MHMHTAKIGSKPLLHLALEFAIQFTTAAFGSVDRMFNMLIRHSPLQASHTLNRRDAPIDLGTLPALTNNLASDLIGLALKVVRN
jgi:hypothetical protein